MKHHAAQSPHSERELFQLAAGWTAKAPNQDRHRRVSYEEDFKPSTVQRTTQAVFSAKGAYGVRKRATFAPTAN